ncbi:pRL2-8 [Streptomyces sp. NBC_01381]|nr:pRL2-8 [Streptomyces sp. NBC_01381]
MFGTSPKTAQTPRSVPKRECPQCWRHAYDPQIHRGLRGDCAACVDHMINGCPGFNRR